MRVPNLTVALQLMTSEISSNVMKRYRATTAMDFCRRRMMPKHENISSQMNEHVD